MALTSRSRGPYRLGDQARLAFRCLPSDIDLNLHLNNARYLMLADVGRVDLFIRSGLWKLARQKGWAPMLGGIQTAFVKEVKLWKRFEVVSTIETWRDRQVLGMHRFVLEDGQTAALIMTTGGVFDTRNRCFIEMDRIFHLLDAGAQAPPLTEQQERFLRLHENMRAMAKQGD